jgi:hypothetical protein
MRFLARSPAFVGGIGDFVVAGLDDSPHAAHIRRVGTRIS